MFKSRIMALADPKKYMYAAERESMFNEMKDEVQKSYTLTKGSLVASGLPAMDVQRLAITSASNTFATLNAILETQFPSGSTELNVQTSAKDAFPGMVTAPTSSRAPRRAPRRKATKKK